MFDEIILSNTKYAKKQSTWFRNKMTNHLQISKIDDISLNTALDYLKLNAYNI
jgi:tRNA A37 N6-isopentenylltransferase MiaA